MYQKGASGERSSTVRECPSASASSKAVWKTEPRRRGSTSHSARPTTSARERSNIRSAEGFHWRICHSRSTAQKPSGEAALQASRSASLRRDAASASTSAVTSVTKESSEPSCPCRPGNVVCAHSQ